MAATLLLSQKIPVFAQALDAAGAPVDFSAPPIFVVSDAGVASLEFLAPTDAQPPAGQYGMLLVPSAIGTVTVSASAEAVLGDESTKLTGNLDFTITAPLAQVAASIAVSAGSAF